METFSRHWFKRALWAKFAAALLYMIPLLGCGHQGEVAPDSKFVNLFVELRLTEMTYGKDSPMARLVRQDALKAAGYTREQFLAQTEELLQDERRWVPFQKAVNARIDSLLAMPQKEDPGKAAAKSANAAGKVNTKPPRKGGD